jgi:hypothetical protein
MSNKNLKNVIDKGINDYKSGRISLLQLCDLVVSTASAIEAIPYSLVKELRSIEYELTVAQGFEADGFEAKPNNGITRLKNWLLFVPD